MMRPGRVIFIFRFCLFLGLISLPFLLNSRSSGLMKEGLSEKINWLAKHESVKRSGLPEQALAQALSGLQRRDISSLLTSTHILTIVDFTRSSNTERLFVLDLLSGEIICQSLVAHGKGSGEEYATRFSNRAGSFQSSTGFYVTGETYEGQHGYSMYLKGMDRGINDAAGERAIVFHAADYVSRDFIAGHGRLGRSQGCFALPPEQNRELIDRIKGGSCVFAYAH